MILEIIVFAVLVSRDDISDAIVRGENFLLVQLWDTARVPVYRSHTSGDTFLLYGRPDSTDWGTAFFLDMARFSKSPEIIWIATVAAENIYSHKLPGDVWNYYPGMLGFPADIDCIGVISWELARFGYLADNIDTVLLYRDPEGSGGFLTWLDAGYNDVDAGANANLCRWFLSQGYTDTALMRYLEGQADSPITHYYWSSLSVDYMISRIYRDESSLSDSAKRKILNRVLASWPWHPPFNTAMAANVLINLDYHGFELEWAVNELILSQEPDGGWPAFAFYTGPGLNTPIFGSREMTTVFALLALYRYNQIAIGEETSGPDRTPSSYDILGRLIDQPKPYRLVLRNGVLFWGVK